MKMVSSPLEKTKQSAVVLANAAELVGYVIKDIAGNDISNSINGTSIRMTRVVEQLALQRMTKRLAK